MNQYIIPLIPFISQCCLVFCSKYSQFKDTIQLFHSTVFRIKCSQLTGFYITGTFEAENSELKGGIYFKQLNPSRPMFSRKL